MSYPWYWYGVKALNTKDVVISGFYDSSTFEGIIRWSHDGGATWTNDIVLTSTGWVQRVRFASHKDALIMDLVDGSTNSAPTPPTVAEPQRTGPTSYRTPMVAGSACCPIVHARASGINYCDSSNAGAAWTCRASIDSVFDGPVFFVND